MFSSCRHVHTTSPLSLSTAHEHGMSFEKVFYGQWKLSDLCRGLLGPLVLQKPTFGRVRPLDKDCGLHAPNCRGEQRYFMARGWTVFVFQCFSGQGLQ